MKTKRAICLILTILVGYQSYGQNVDLMDGCVGKYLFNNNTADESPLKNNGKAFGGMFTTDRTGKSNSAYHFEGNGEYIEIGQKISNDFTVCFWAKTMQIGYNAENDAFYGSTGMVDNECIGCGNDFGIDLLDNRAIFGLDVYQLPSTRYINSGQWIHIAAVRDSSQERMSLYLNGELDTTINTPDYIKIEGEPTIYFGKLHASSEDQKPFFNGDLDDIYIFSRALSAAEVVEIAYGGNKPTGFQFNGSVVDINIPIVLRNLQFLSGKSEIQPKGKVELNYVVKWLNENPGVEIELSGHTSNDGDKETNYKLSQARSESCKKYLISKGVAENRISTKGYGSDNPVVSNQTEEGRMANRRVELKITKK